MPGNQSDHMGKFLQQLWPVHNPVNHAVDIFGSLAQGWTSGGVKNAGTPSTSHRRMRRTPPFASLLAGNPGPKDASLKDASAKGGSAKDASPKTSSSQIPPTTKGGSSSPAEPAKGDKAATTANKAPAVAAGPKESPTGKAAERASGEASTSGQKAPAGSNPGPPSWPWGGKRRKPGPGQKPQNWVADRLPGWLPKKMPNLQPFWVILAPPGQPDKKRLMTVQDFFKYTEEEGKQFWRELDRDGNGRVSAEDVKAILRQRKLPESYGSEFIKAARGNRWWSGTIDWEEFKAMVDEREPKMLRAFTSLEVNSAGSLEPGSIKGTLAKVGVAGTDAHAKAMIRALGVEEDGAVSYGKFRNFLILLPEDKLTGLDPGAVWFEAAAMVPFGPPPSERSSGQRTGKMLLTAALAGGIASCVSTLALFPLDTMKTRMQSTAGATFASIAKSAPDIGVKGLYRGIIPAATGNFVSHGVRTFSYEASFSALTTLTGGAAELQMQGLASGMGTFLGTCIRIPCEVLKQRLQTGKHPNMIEAIKVATKLEGPRGLFRGTVATLSREVPFYVLGIVFFEQFKKAAKGNSFGGKGRELAPWEMLALGALAGAIASVSTCPADVMKTRVMTAAAETAVDPKAIFLGIIQNEGVGALFKGALFRAAWTAPQGAMNFGFNEIARNALSEKTSGKDANLELEPAT